MADVIIQKKNEVHLKLSAEPHVLYELAQYFTFDVPGAKFSPAYKRGGWNGKIQLLSTTTGEIYCGLLDRVLPKLKIMDSLMNSDTISSMEILLNTTILLQKKVSKV